MKDRVRYALAQGLTTRALAIQARCRLVARKHCVYNMDMLRSFADKETERLSTSGHSKRFPLAIQRRAMMRLSRLAEAAVIEDLLFPPSHRLEALKGERAGQWSIRINDQWRLCFRFESGNAFDVEIVDYH